MKKIGYFTLCVALLFTIISASGCVRAYRVQVDSISDRSADVSRVYQILPGNKDTGVNDLQFKEFAGMLVRTLALQGYTLAGVSDHAEIEIYLSYGVGEPEKHTYSYTTPVWGQTGMDIYTQTSQVTSSDNTSSTQYSRTYVEPQYGVTGFTSETAEYIAYKKYAILDAFDIKNAKTGTKLKEIWKTSISSLSNSKDLRKVFPALLAASMKHIGTNTGEEIAIDVAEDAPVLKAIKGN